MMARRDFFCALAASVVAAGARLPIGLGEEQVYTIVSCGLVPAPPLTLKRLRQIHAHLEAHAIKPIVFRDQAYYFLEKPLRRSIYGDVAENA